MSTKDIILLIIFCIIAAFAVISDLEEGPDPGPDETAQTQSL